MDSATPEPRGHQAPVGDPDPVQRDRLAMVAAAEHVRDAVIVVDEDFVVVSWNPSAAQLYGRGRDEAIGMPISDVVGADIDPRLAARVGGVRTTVQQPLAGGRKIVVHWTSTGLGHGFVIVAHADQRPMSERLQAVFDALHEAVLVVGNRGSIEMANPAAITMLQIDPAALPGISIDQLPLAYPGGRSPIELCLSTGEIVADRTMTVTTGGTGPRWMACTCTPISDLPDDATVLVTLIDITDFRRRRVLREWELRHDYLTGLLNRAGIVDGIDALVRSARDAASDVAVCYIDLDEFKLVNDSLGHAAGDGILREVAGRLDLAFDKSGVIGRIGGDEFVVAAPADRSVGVEKLVAQIHQVIGTPIVVGSRAEHITASVGLTVATDTTRKAADLVRDAGVAVYQAKSAGRVPYVRFHAEQRAAIRAKRSLENELRSALSADLDQFHLVYQPIYRLADRHVMGCEALIRWQHPVYGAIAPSEFIPVAERSELIEQVGDYVLTTATREFAACEWTTGLTLSVNFSRRELTDPSLPQRIADVVDGVGMDRSSLCVEVTERALAIEVSGIEEMVASLRDLRFQVALDDFGTGESSLSQLYQLPINIIKTAKEFTDALEHHSGAEAILAGVAAMAAASGARVIVEGIETEAQASIVAEVGCGYAQGYLFGRPQSLAEIGAVIGRSDRLG